LALPRRADAAINFTNSWGSGIRHIFLAPLSEPCGLWC
jgi:hypothetical protein